jgi:Predicted glycosyltransferases
MFIEDNYSTDVSIIIPCKNEVDNLKNTVDSIMNSKNKLSFEIIVVDDGSTDGSCDFIKQDKNIYGSIKLISSKNLGVAGGRNMGASKAEGKYLLFIDAHVYVPDYWLDNLFGTMEQNNADGVSPAIKDKVGGGIGYGETWNERLENKWITDMPKNGQEIPIAAGGAFGIKRKVFEDIGGFDKHYEIWGKEDEEISVKLWLFGYKIVINPYVEIIHLFKLFNPSGVTGLEILYNRLCMYYSHFSDESLPRVLDLYKNDSFYSKALQKLMLNEDMLRQRKEYLNRRKYDEKYFLEKFNISF